MYFYRGTPTGSAAMEVWIEAYSIPRRAIWKCQISKMY